MIYAKKFKTGGTVLVAWYFSMIGPGVPMIFIHEKIIQQKNTPTGQILQKSVFSINSFGDT